MKKAKQMNEAINLITGPKVYLVGRPSLAGEGLAEFFKDEDVSFSIRGKRVTSRGSKKWDVNTDNPAEILCMIAGKICYDAYGKGNNDIGPYIHNIIESGHHSVIEHAQWNFIIKGSRIWSHEHVRHRIGVGISQRSQRYVKESDAHFMLRPDIYNNPKALAIFKKQIESGQKAYDILIELLAEDIKKIIPDSTLRVKTVRSSARSIMPNATETYIFWSANARALRHYIDLRANKHADWEIREVALQILKIMQKEAPNIFADYEIKKTPEGFEVAVTKIDRCFDRIKKSLEEQRDARSGEPETQDKINKTLNLLESE